MGISFRNIMLLGLCVSLGACAFKKEDAEDKQRQELVEDVHRKIQDEKDTTKLDLKSSNVIVKFEERDLGYYDMVITWPDSVGKMEIYIDNNPFATVEGKNVFKKIVMQGDSVSYKLRAYAPSTIGGAFMDEFEDVVTAPKDFLVYRNIKLHSNLKAENINRAYFRTDTKVITNGFDFTLNAKSLYVEEIKDHVQSGNPAQYSQIITLDESSDSLNNNRSSKISITAEHAKGRLFIAMIGKNGQNGRDATDLINLNKYPLLPAIAENGENGTDGIISPGRRCPPTRNKDVQCEEVPPKCLTAPSNGQDGKNGIAGYAGEDGESGTSTGDLKINIGEFQEFSIEVYQHPGVGGRGGKGSAGQSGGKGGRPGTSHGVCPAAMPGKNGKDGEPGKNGKDGADGSRGLIETNVRPRII
ncbi:hypothetical protein B9G69_014655 [Bdellovibrio sp. SKB1291214]|uniref:hypothetical protein n=1 Tax=Bdellovibrio sp. SKB1291214 TaxID=1732569 RepID=UPI000B51BC03|nr:hypothetical protein [Bdellovibrio sp. SKB1291214]UYL08282.1 hypothetical protein B9G69_014655 [Bdellovibrio sp. SKB1291214]